MGFLNILPIENEQTYTREGYYNSLSGILGSQSLPAFCTGNIINENTIDTFSLRYLKFNGRNKTIVSQKELDENLIFKTNRLYFLSGIYYEDIESGIYEYYIKDSANNEWISEPFMYCQIPSSDFADFNNDFNNDFLI